MGKMSEFHSVEILFLTDTNSSIIIEVRDATYGTNEKPEEGILLLYIKLDFKIKEDNDQELIQSDPKLRSQYTKGKKSQLEVTSVYK